MAADEDEAPDDERDGDVDPSSGTRVKKSATASVQLFVADFQRRAQGLSGPELQAEVDRLIDKMVERHVAVLPAAIRDELRESFRDALENDPTVSEMLRDLRAAAAGRDVW